MSKNYGKARNPTMHTMNLYDELDRLGFNPVGELIRTLQEIDEPKDRADIIEKIWRYCFPQRKAVEMSGKVNATAISLTPAQLNKLISADNFINLEPIHPTQESTKIVVADKNDPFLG